MSTSEVAQRCGLPEEIVIALLAAGWTYQERIGKPSEWLSPAYRFVEVPESDGPARHFLSGVDQ